MVHADFCGVKLLSLKWLATIVSESSRRPLLEGEARKGRSHHAANKDQAFSKGSNDTLVFRRFQDHGHALLRQIVSKFVDLSGLEEPQALTFVSGEFGYANNGDRLYPPGKVGKRFRSPHGILLKDAIAWTFAHTDIGAVCLVELQQLHNSTRGFCVGLHSNLYPRLSRKHLTLVLKALMNPLPANVSLVVETGKPITVKDERSAQEKQNGPSIRYLTRLLPQRYHFLLDHSVHPLGALIVQEVTTTIMMMSGMDPDDEADVTKARGMAIDQLDGMYGFNHRGQSTCQPFSTGNNYDEAVEQGLKHAYKKYFGVPVTNYSRVDYSERWHRMSEAEQQAYYRELSRRRAENRQELVQESWRLYLQRVSLYGPTYLSVGKIEGAAFTQAVLQLKNYSCNNMELFDEQPWQYPGFRSRGGDRPETPYQAITGHSGRTMIYVGITAGGDLQRPGQAVAAMFHNGSKKAAREAGWEWFPLLKFVDRDYDDRSYNAGWAEHHMQTWLQTGPLRRGITTTWRVTEPAPVHGSQFNTTVDSGQIIVYLCLKFV